MRRWHHTYVLPSCRKGLPGFLLAIILTFTASAVPVHAGPHRNMINLRGDEVLVPNEVPPRKYFVFQRLISVDDRLVVFLYRDPRFQHDVDYSETYSLNGELLEIAWYRPTEGLKRARDINFGNSEATAPARILEIVREFRGHNRELDMVTTVESLWSDMY